MKTAVTAIVALSLLSAPLAADPAAGIWRTEPDRKDLISHIEIKTCGAAMCGWVKQAFDTSGNSVQTKNVGRKLFWDVKSNGDGTYDGGTVHVPLLEIDAKAKMKLNGNTLKVTGCKGPICDGQTWTRVR